MWHEATAIVHALGLRGRRRAPACHPRRHRNLWTGASGGLATTVRDFTSATLQVETGEDSTGFGDQVEPNLWSTTVFEDVEVVSSGPEGPYEVVGDSSQSSVPRVATPQQQTPPSTAQAAAGGAGQASETRERAAAQEDRRLELEERGLALQERELQQRVCEFEDAHEERRQEMAILLQQNQLLANVLQQQPALFLLALKTPALLGYPPCKACNGRHGGGTVFWQGQTSRCKKAPQLFSSVGSS
ncbi:hypothetical protein MTO96_044199 [Rhipicephalus appendiculatus]